MARTAKSANALQVFRGGFNKLPLHAAFLGGDCCAPAARVDIDRLPVTQNWENANVHTSPIGGRGTWSFAGLSDSERLEIVEHINRVGVGAQLEVALIPTFGFWQALRVAVLEAETGLTFTVRTRNGTVIPTGQRFEVVEALSATECGVVTRTQTTVDWAAGEETVGDLGAGQAKYSYAVSNTGGSFALEADVVILQVASVPAGGVVGLFDLTVDVAYTSYGRSESQIG